MKNTTLVRAAIVVGGIALGALAHNVAVERRPELEPAILWVSGVLVGAGVTRLMLDNKAVTNGNGAKTATK